MGRWYDLMVAVGHDLPDFPTPSRQEHAARFEHPWPTSAEEALLAWDGGWVVGAASCALPQAANLSVVHLELIVHPRHRRRGIGTRLLEEVYAAARRSRCQIADRSRGDEATLAESWTHAGGYSLVR